MWKQRGKALVSTVGAAAAGGIWFLFSSAVPDLQAANNMRDAAAQVAADAVQQYDMVKRSGTPIEICVYAGYVAAAYVQSKNEPEYISWKDTERQDCARAGMPKI